MAIDPAGRGGDGAAPIDVRLLVEGFLDKTRPIYEGEWGQLSAGTMAAGLCQRLAAEEKGLLPGASPAATAVELGRLSESLLRSLGRPDQYQSPWPEMPWSVAMLSELNTEYLLANQGRMGFVLLRLVDEDGRPVVQHGPQGDHEVFFGAQLEVTRPPGLVAGAPIDAAMAIGVPPFGLPAGRRFSWRLTIDGESKTDWAVEFATRADV